MKSKFKFVGIIVIGIIIFGAQGSIIDHVYAQDDLVFTAVSPCRIVDTREPGPVSGVFDPGETRDFFVFGTTAISNQGGNPAGCPSPGGEPSAVHINVTAVPQSGQGNFAVFPANVGPPNASLLNYKAGVQNIANAATIRTFVQVSSEEISVINRNGFSHLVIDILGYYFPMP